jgi:hypothetical protein
MRLAMEEQAAPVPGVQVVVVVVDVPWGLPVAQAAQAVMGSFLFTKSSRNESLRHHQQQGG